MTLPYICDFRIILRVYPQDNPKFSRKWEYEEYYFETWTDEFKFRPIRKPKEKVPIIMTNQELGQEHFSQCFDLYEIIVDEYIKPTCEAYYEVVGKLHILHTQDYYGEWDSQDEFTELKFQRIYKSDLDNFLKRSS